ncbi:hypothetical protein STANM309S_06072 [Streptomyces tanashiensis]
MLDTAGVPVEGLLGVGVGVPGIVARTAEEGARSCTAQTIGWHAVPLERLLRESLDLPASVPYWIDNGAKTLGQADMWFGAGRGARSAVVALFGSGVGACVVTDPTESGRALEWGHLTVRVRGRRCRCGARGCLGKAYAGAEALPGALARGGRAASGGRGRGDGPDRDAGCRVPGGPGGGARRDGPRSPGGDRRVPGRRFR